MNATSIFFAILALIACVVALQQPVVMKPQADALECEACHVIVNAIDSWLAENSTVGYVDARLFKVCALIPHAAKTCDAIVVAGVPQVINWIETNETPEIACGPTQLKVCTSK
eukprot:Phypoly_transcript_15895.p2 GENE.Phypoly_transcript_15895~~Phypoly_transcript_15895.p2  ORF type:complete len:113 (+),score=18.60 Phypoly_transcript_15895:545-883(+)